MGSAGNRLGALLAASETFTGIDFVQVVEKCDQTRLRIYFLTDTLALRPPFEDVGDPSVTPEPIEPRDIRIYSLRGEAPDVQVVECAGGSAMVWGDDAESMRRYLEICVAEPGGFTDYSLRIADGRIDQFFNDVRFSFKVGCDDRLDCAESRETCPEDEMLDFPVDYLARDFVSFRNALLDFAAQKYPNWQMPVEADQGVMLLEIMASLGDELSYLQDRINREAYLETATERRSLRQMARLLDYEIHDGRMASTLLELAVLAGVTSVAGGSPVWAPVAGSVPVQFELGNGLHDTGVSFLVDSQWNPGRFTVYWFDDKIKCLKAGATELYVRNDPANPQNPGGTVLTPPAATLWGNGRLVLLRDLPADPSEAPRYHFVRVTGVELMQDELFGIDLARISWDASDALPFDMPLEQLQISANIVPATAGATRSQEFRLGPLLNTDDPDLVLPAVEREGPLFTGGFGDGRRVDRCEEDDDRTERAPIFLFSLPGTLEQGLAFADPLEDLRRTVPEVRVFELDTESGTPQEWNFERSLLSAGRDDSVFTIEDGTWGRIFKWREQGVEREHRDYVSGAGSTVRFGNGEFGSTPAPDGKVRVDYRLGSGRSASVPADSVTRTTIGDQSSVLGGKIISVTNPLPVTNGVAPESHTDIKLLTPQAYRSETFFAVRPEDYGAQAEKLSFVQRAQGSFRWTGSWLSAQVAVDPFDSFELSGDRLSMVASLLNCRRQAGREVLVKNPRYVNLDLWIRVCLNQGAFAGQVQSRILDALFGSGGARGRVGALDPDHFTFGTPLRRSALEAAILAVDGVDSVIGIQLRKHGVTEYRSFDTLAFEVSGDEVIRIENSALSPERGSVSLVLEGGA